MWDVCIIGGGAAGLSLAIEAARKNPKDRIAIIEKNSRLGKKILSTGNGRCNIGNIYGADIDLVLEFFETCGILIKNEEEGRLYPRSEQASSVVDALEREIRKLDIKLFFDSQVADIEYIEGNFKIILEKGNEIFSKKLAIATGGKAAPQFGTTGDGYRMAKNLGHTIVKLAPILMPINCEGDFSHIKGVRAKAKVSLLKNGTIIATETGELQFTEDGLSGICVFNLSRLIKINSVIKIEEAFKEYQIQADLVEEIEKEKLIRILVEKQKIMGEDCDYLILNSIINDKLLKYVGNIAFGNRNKKISSLSKDDIIKLVETSKNLSFTVTGGKGWKFAQGTAGGVSLDEIDSDTFESKLVKGLFFAGEVIDYDGPCGGFNLQNAWSNGIKAGRNIVKET